jgi:hypothetical protein
LDQLFSDSASENTTHQFGECLEKLIHIPGSMYTAKYNASATFYKGKNQSKLISVLFTPYSSMIFCSGLFYEKAECQSA